MSHTLLYLYQLKLYFEGLVPTKLKPNQTIHTTCTYTTIVILAQLLLYSRRYHQLLKSNRLGTRRFTPEKGDQNLYPQSSIGENSLSSTTISTIPLVLLTIARCGCGRNWSVAIANKLPTEVELVGFWSNYGKSIDTRAKCFDECTYISSGNATL